jgi:beta-lactamase regulating signal transducer with metallopeptidase domain
MNGFPIPWLAESALCGSTAIVLLLLMRPVIRRWLGARAVHLLWLIVLLRLLIPWTPHTPLALLPRPAQTEASPSSIRLRSFVVDAPWEQIPASLPEALPRPRRPSFATSITGLFALIWILGAAGLFSLSLAAALRTARLVGRAREIAADSPAGRLLASLPMSVRRMRILETHDVKSPALCGFLRPAILLPPGWADSLPPEDLRCVLLHEIGHHRRGDVLWRWAFLVARAVHWFNPLVWLAEREMRVDQEMACDEWVLSCAGGIDSQRYGEVLLRACRNLTALRIVSPGHATMAESSAGLARRIRHIARMKPHGWPALGGAAALAAALCLIATSPGGAQDAPRAPGASPEIPPAPAPVPASTPAPAFPPLPAPSASASAKPKGPQILIEAMFVERPSNALKEIAQALPAAVNSDSPRIDSVFEDSQFQMVVRALHKMKGVDVLNAPRETCVSGQKAVIEMVQEFRYPTEYKVEKDGSGRVTPTAFETRNVGVTLEVLPTIGARGRIDMVLTPSVVEFLGFVNYGAGRPPRQSLKGDALAELMKNSFTRRPIIAQPVFDTRRISTSASIRSGQTLIVGGIGSINGADVSISLSEWKDALKRYTTTGKLARTRKTTAGKSERYLLIFVTARILEDAKPAPAESPDPTPPL